MKFKRTTQIEKGDLDIAPLIDVVFQLLIFFMLTSSFIYQPGIKVNLPKAVTSEALGEETFILSINSENIIYYKQKPITMKELKSKLKDDLLPNKPLIIKADRKASLGRVVEVWDMCRSLGISQVNIATNPLAE